MKKVVIIGGGFAGLNAAKTLGNTDFEVILLDRQNHHLFQPLLYQVASAVLSPSDIAVAFRQELRRFPNIQVFLTEVSDINLDARQVISTDGHSFKFDYLMVSVGAKHSYFGHPEWATFAPGLKTLADAIHLRETILCSFEKAEKESDPATIQALLTFVIIGGGPTGVEMAGAIAEIAQITMSKNFRHINPSLTRVFLIEAAPQILPVYPKSLGKKAVTFLERLGVTVKAGQAVTLISEHHVELGNEHIDAHTIIWAAGNQASPLLTHLNTPLDRQGRVIVRPDLSIERDPNIFVVGDAAHVTDPHGNPLPALAPVAIQAGTYVGKIIKQGLPREIRRPFRYFDRGSLATIGKSKAVGLIGPLPVSGLFAWLAWSFIHILYLIDFQNRIIVFLEWVFAYFFNKRGARLIVK